MMGNANKASASAADEVAAAEANLKAAQARLAAARQRFIQNSCDCSHSVSGQGSPFGVCVGDVSAGKGDVFAASGEDGCAAGGDVNPTGGVAAGGGSDAAAGAAGCAYAAADRAAAQGPRNVSSPAGPRAVPAKDHVAAGIMALFFGLFGIHKFYLGYTNEGFIMLAITILGSLATFGVAAFVVQLVAVVEGLIYLIKTQAQFEQDYVYGRRKWL